MSRSITVSVIKSAYHLITACVKVVLLAAGCMLEVLAVGLILLYQIKVLVYVFLIYVNILMTPGNFI